MLWFASVGPFDNPRKVKGGPRPMEALVVTIVATAIQKYAYNQDTRRVKVGDGPCRKHRSDVGDRTVQKVDIEPALAGAPPDAVRSVCIEYTVGCIPSA